MDPRVQQRIEQIQTTITTGDYDRAQGLMSLVGFTRAQRGHIQATVQMWRQNNRFPQIAGHSGQTRKTELTPRIDSASPSS